MIQITVRPLRREDIDRPVTFSIKGFAAEVDGQLAGYAGIEYSTGKWAVSECNELAQKHPRVVVLIARKLTELMFEESGPFYAIPDPAHESARSLLLRLGFVPYSEKVYRWDRTEAPISKH